jgi:MFS transporter, putative metabolite:H+ symporter
LSLAFALPVLDSYLADHSRRKWTAASSYVGQIFGALTFSWLAEKYGRIRSATAAVALMWVMSLGCALSTSFVMLFAFRFVQGIGLGGEMPVAATYISEVSKARGRGRF